MASSDRVVKVVTVPLERLIALDIDSFNDYLNMLVTGNEHDLTDISERAVGVSDDGQSVLLEVTGVVETFDD